MNILLVSPKVDFKTNITTLADWYKSPEGEQYSSMWFRFCTSIGLLIVAALTPKEHHVQFIDENIDSIPFHEHFDIVGITAMTPQALRAYEIADCFRERGTKVILGGIHPTLLPNEAILHADSVVIGEAENTWADVIKDAGNSSLKQFYRSTSNTDITQSPVPDYTLLNAASYLTLPLQTTRGCPHKCDYCASSKIFGAKYRRKNLKQIENEINKLASIRNNQRIFITDDNFAVNRRATKEMLRMFKDWDFRFYAQSDISIGSDQKLLKMMYEAGLRDVFIGLETIRPQGLKELESDGWKAKQLKKYPELINQIQAQGIMVTGAFIVGLDSDDQNIFSTMTDFILNNHLVKASILILTPLPGTSLRERLSAEKRLLDYPWDMYTGYDVLFQPKKMTKVQLEDGLESIYRRIFKKEDFSEKMQHFVNLEIQRRQRVKQELMET